MWICIYTYTSYTHLSQPPAFRRPTHPTFPRFPFLRRMSEAPADPAMQYEGLVAVVKTASVEGPPQVRGVDQLVHTYAASCMQLAWVGRGVTPQASKALPSPSPLPHTLTPNYPHRSTPPRTSPASPSWGPAGSWPRPCGPSRASAASSCWGSRRSRRWPPRARPPGRCSRRWVGGFVGEGVDRVMVPAPSWLGMVDRAMVRRRDSHAYLHAYIRAHAMTTTTPRAGGGGGAAVPHLRAAPLR